MNTKAIAELEADLADTLARMDKRRDAHLKAMMGGQTTRARTTTYNAEMGRLAERRDQLRDLLAKARSAA
jgi:predicted  nucleic acid-binding Zn-ribbon protein